MSEQKPVSLGQLWMLGVKALDQANKSTSTSVRGEHRLGKFAAQWVFRVILDSSCEEAAVEVEDACQHP